MLSLLNITNFAIIKRLEIAVKPGLNVLSGETGAGKSIIINALNLILGGRASADLVRGGAKEAGVAAHFSIPENPGIKDALDRFEISFDGEVVIQRTLSKEGRGRVSINGSLATLQMLSQLAPRLVSISGQHEHQSLLRPETHLYVLDEFGALTDERLLFARRFEEWQGLKTRIEERWKALEHMRERQELSHFQRDEIDKVCIAPGEDESLASERHRLQHGEKLRSLVTESYQALYEKRESVMATLGQCRKRMGKGAEVDPGLSGIQALLSEIELKLEDVSLSLRDYQRTIPVDPERLEAVVGRLELINRMKRKYGPTIDDILQFRAKLASAVEDFQETEAALNQMEKEQKAKERELESIALALSARRKEAAQRLEKAMEQELHQLHMEKARFQVLFHEPEDGRKECCLGEIRADGLDRVEFLMTPNVGEEMKALSKIASGGELSRVMLALKTILASRASVETLVFDEVDSGISGATAQIVGEKLLSLAKYHQILCITHLPQIASQGPAHFLVKKKVVEGRTETTLLELDREARIREIARLLGGKTITHAAMARAEEMLGQGQGRMI